MGKRGQPLHYKGLFLATLHALPYDRSSVVSVTHFHTLRSLPNTQTRGPPFNPFHRGSSFLNPYKLVPHPPGLMVWHVDRYGDHVCNPCGRSFNNYSALMQHLNQSSSHNYCDNCDRDFTTYSGLVQHYANSPRHDYCKICDEHFDDSDDLDRHMDDRHWWCRDCNTIFSGDEELQDHFRESHANRYCEICETLFGSESRLRSVCLGFRCDTPVS